MTTQSRITKFQETTMPKARSETDVNQSDVMKQNNLYNSTEIKAIDHNPNNNLCNNACDQSHKTFTRANEVNTYKSTWNLFPGIFSQIIGSNICILKI